MAGFVNCEIYATKTLELLDVVLLIFFVKNEP